MKVATNQVGRLHAHLHNNETFMKAVVPALIKNKPGGFEKKRYWYITKAECI